MSEVNGAPSIMASEFKDSVFCNPEDGAGFEPQNYDYQKSMPYIHSPGLPAYLFWPLQCWTFLLGCAEWQFMQNMKKGQHIAVLSGNTFLFWEMWLTIKWHVISNSTYTPYRLRNQSLAIFFGDEDTKTLFGGLSLRKTRCHLMGGNDSSGKLGRWPM